MRGRAAKERVDELLALFDLTAAAKRLVKAYSGRLVAQGSPDALKSELRGDAVVIELAPGAPGVARAAVEAMAREVTIAGRTIRARMLASPASRGAMMLAAVVNRSVTIVVQGIIVVLAGFATMAFRSYQRSL
jgi:ABC-2 type transport system ATP-binding protein